MNSSGLSDLMDRLLGSRSGPPLARTGRSCAELAGKFTDEQHGSQMIATYFWWSVSRSPVITEILDRGFGRQAAGRVDPVMVIHGGGTRFSLLLIDPSYDGRPLTAWLNADPSQRLVRFRPETNQLDVAPRLLSQALRQEFGRRDSIQDTDLAKDVEISASLMLRAVEEVSGPHRFGMALVPAPLRKQTAGTGAPTPATGVHSRHDREPHATIGHTGMLKGKPYGTTVLHALDDNGRAYVRGAEVPVLSRDEVTDSCLLGLNQPLNSFCGLRGAMTKSTPRLLQEGHFHGAASTEERVVLNGYTPDIVKPGPTAAVRLFTEPHTSPGDSGAGLIDEDDHVIGFAIDHASFSVDHATATWVWAAQVMRTHKLIT